VFALELMLIASLNSMLINWLTSDELDPARGDSFTILGLQCRVQVYWVMNHH